jgi:DNA-binding CsgD family transcriptional regulator
LETNTVPKLIGLIYDSVASTTGWQTFLDAFADAVQSRRAALLLREGREDVATVLWYGWPDEDAPLYMGHFAAIDPWNAGIVNKPEGSVGTDDELCAREVMEASEAFKKFYAPRDCIYGLGGVILVTAAGNSMITAVRGAEDGPFGEPELEIVRALMPHLRRAALLHGEFGSMRDQLAIFTGHLDRYPHGFLVADARRRVLYSNTAAREIARSGDGLAIEGGCIVATPSRQRSAFDEAVSAVTTERGGVVRRFEIARPSRKRSYRLILMPVEGSGTIPLGVSVPAASIIVIDSESPADLNFTLLRETYSLTPAEAAVASALTLGRNVSEIAAESQTSVETVRTHVKRLLSKTGTDRQGELIALILQSVPLNNSSFVPNSGDDRRQRAAVP